MDVRKAIILAGGTGSRLSPLTKITNKHLLPVYDRPMIDYPLKTLSFLGAKDILVISGREHAGDFLEYLGSGEDRGVNFHYRVQEKAGGIAEALGLAEDFADERGVWVILGDNIFDNYFNIPNDFLYSKACVFLKIVDENRRFGVPVIENNKVAEIEEKPENPKSQFAVTGLYYFPPDVFDIIRTLKPSERGELEITDVNNAYAHMDRLQHARVVGFWSDAGTFESLAKSVEWAKIEKQKHGKEI